MTLNDYEELGLLTAGEKKVLLGNEKKQGAAAVPERDTVLAWLSEELSIAFHNSPRL